MMMSEQESGGGGCGQSKETLLDLEKEVFITSGTLIEVGVIQSEIHFLQRLF